MSHLDLPIHHISLETFCRQAKELYAEDQAAFVHFVLGGLLRGKQVVVDPFLNSLDGGRDLRANRDYDSILGIDKELCIWGPLQVYPVAKHDDTLTVSVHLTASFECSGEPFEAPVHKIPNICLGLFGNRSMIRVLIPDLYDKERSAFLTQEEQRIFYEKGLRPTVAEIIGDYFAEWPATYNDEMFRARGKDGRLVFQTKMLPHWANESFGNLLRENLEMRGVRWAAGLCFLHQVRGTKQTCRHIFGRKVNTKALDVFLVESHLVEKQMRNPSAQWWVDVGVEITSPEGHSLAWRTDSHFHIVKQICALDDSNADRMTKLGSSNYTRDLASHLSGVSGCRISPGPRGRGKYKTAYLQLYMTDKSLVYRPENGHYGKYITCTQVLQGKEKQFLDGLYETYRNAIKKSSSAHARIEMRVPLVFATDVMRSFPGQLLRESLVSFPNNVWWGLRSFRCLAISLVLRWQAEGPSRWRSTKPALLLTMASVWLTNSLHSTPDMGASSKDLMVAILPHVIAKEADPDTFLYAPPALEHDSESGESESEDEDVGHNRVGRVVRPAISKTVPNIPYGLLFLRKFRIGKENPVPRFENSNLFVKDKSFLYFFKLSFDDVEHELFKTTLVRPVHPNRVANKMRRTVGFHNWGQQSSEKRFNLSSRGHKLPAPICDDGSDMSDNEEIRPRLDDEQEPDIDTDLTLIWNQFLQDITSTAPNKKCAFEPSYCRLSQGQRTQVNDATYKNHNLAAYFYDCQWKVAPKADWDNNFRRLFPTQLVQISKRCQNFGSMKYLGLWTKIKEDADENTIGTMASELKKLYDELYWMPLVQSDRVWCTRHDARLYKSSGRERRTPAPQVLVRGLAPDWIEETDVE